VETSTSKPLQGLHQCPYMIHNVSLGDVKIFPLIALTELNLTLNKFIVAQFRHRYVIDNLLAQAIKLY
jgi:hypothetical protein